MPSTYKTPGVYIEEISTLPASIAQVETAIPAFVGFTEIHVKNGMQVNDKPTRIKSLLEYEEIYGVGQKISITVNLKTDKSVDNVSFKTKFCLYDSMRMFFLNGGGPCYIVSVGKYDVTTESDQNTALLKGLETLRKKDEPTLILFPDATNLLTKDHLGTLQRSALKQCNDLQDRFCIFDLKNGDNELNVETDGETPDLAYRNAIGAQYLKYGAAYYPSLRTSLGFNFSYENIKDDINESGTKTLSSISPDSLVVDHLEFVLIDQTNFNIIYKEPTLSDSLINIAEIKTKPIWQGFTAIEEKYATNTPAISKNRVNARVVYIYEMLKRLISLTLADKKDESVVLPSKNDLFTIHAKDIAAAALTKPYTRIEEIIRKLLSYNLAFTDGTTPAPKAIAGFVAGATVTISGVIYNTAGATLSIGKPIYGGATSYYDAANKSQSAYLKLFSEVVSMYESLEAKILNRKENLELLLRETNPIYANITRAIQNEGIVLPPSAAVAGLYAAVDNERGVWVAPANRSLNGVIGPVINITAQDQAGLNVDVTAGKSINAIRSFTGRGTLVWGARTLAGNSNEWRYIPVRRLFNMIEESVKKATEFVVFEPNDKNTWVRSKAMIENFLGQIWRAGGLAGAKAEHAYIVKVGLGETMSALDILEGRMIIEIHLAAVRPAEFIILRFMHKLQES